MKFWKAPGVVKDPVVVENAIIDEVGESHEGLVVKIYRHQIRAGHSPVGVGCGWDILVTKVGG